jgi:ferric-dicitrate binding protein FerR (iron transport regulator)
VTDFIPSDWFLLDSYLPGRGSAAERATVARWLQGAPAHAERLEALRALHENRHGRRAGYEHSAEQISAQVFAKIRAPKEAHPGAHVRSSQRRFVHPAGVVAMTLGAAAIAATVFVGMRPKMLPAHTAHFSTRPGQFARATLNDGTRVLLGPATTLSVRREQGGTVASVSGRVLLMVAPSSRAPFSVRTGPSTVRVLGTTFSVRRYADERETQLIVMDGRVSVNSRCSSRVPACEVIVPAQTSVIAPDSGVVRKVPTGTIDDSWTSGTLVFRKAPVRNIVAEVGRVYDVEIRVTDTTLAARTLTWTVPVASQSIQHVLTVLGVTLDARITRSGRVITVSPGGEAPQLRQSPSRHSTSEVQHGR